METKQLKKGFARGVYLREDKGGDSARNGRVVVKRFAHPSRLQALRDGRRAHNEFRLLELLHKKGLAVPEPIDVRRVDGGWEVRMQWIPNSRSLLELLEGPRDEKPVDGWGKLIIEMGELLAALHVNGIDHPDLHPGNVLVDSTGKPWVVDFHHARLRRKLSPARIEEDFASFAAISREYLSSEVRLRFLQAWRTAVPAEIRKHFLDWSRLARRVEEKGRFLRRARVERSVGRWLRSSSRCVVLDDGRSPVFQRRDLPRDFWELARSGRADRAVMIVEGDPKANLERIWQNGVRLFEHRLPTLEPLCRREGRDGWAIFGKPVGTRKFESERDATRPEVVAELLGELLGELHDRGLTLSSLEPEQLFTEGGERLLIPPLDEHLEPFDPRPGSSSPRERFHAVSAQMERFPYPQRFVDGYVRGFARQPLEQLELERELRGAL